MLQLTREDVHLVPTQQQQGNQTMENKKMKFALLLATIQIVSAFRFTGYNCEDKRTNISIIDAFKVEDCKPINQTQIVQKKYFNSDHSRETVRNDKNTALLYN